MKLMTFNIQHCFNYLNKKIDYEILALEIKKEDPDIVGLNEIYGEDDSCYYGNQVKKIAELTGYKYYYFAKAFNHINGPYGNAILSKIPIIDSKTIVIREPKIKKNINGYYETRSLLVAKLENGIKVLVTHFGLNEDEIIKEINVLNNYIIDARCILMGDFNISYESQILAPLKEKLYDASKGFCQFDATFPSYNPKIKIDYIFVSKDITVNNSYILKKIISDHFAHIAIIDI